MGGNDDDALKGEAGNDHLDGGKGTNLLDGDDGRNKFKNGTIVDLDVQVPRSIAELSDISTAALRRRPATSRSSKTGWQSSG